MSTKKWMSAIICCAMLAGMLVGCGGEDSSSTGNQTDSSGTQGTETSTAEEEGPYQKGDYSLPISEEGVTLRWMGRDSEEAGTSFLSNKSIIWDEIQKQTNITIEWDVIPNQEYQQVMQVRLSSNTDLPDIICLQGQSDGSFLSKYFDEEVIISLNDLIADYAPNLAQMLEDYPEYKDALTLPSGDFVALGSDLSATKYRTKGVTIRQDWLDKLNLESPTNMDELYEVAKAFVEQDPNGNGEQDEFGIMASSAKELRQLGMGFGLSLVSGSGWSIKDGELRYEFISEEYKEFLSWMNRAYTDGLLPTDFQNADGNVYQQRIATNTLGILGREYINKFVELNNPDGANQENNPGSLWRPVDFVADEEHEVAIPTEPIATIWRSYAITNACTDKVAAIRLLDFIMAGEGRILGTKGIEGVTYNMVGDIPVSITNWRDNVEAGTFLGDSYAPKMITDQDYLGFTESDYFQNDPEAKEWSMEMIDSIVEKAYVPFQPSIPSVEEGKELTTIFADLNTYIDEMYIKFITGEASLDTYDEYVENCKKLGCDTAKEIYEKGMN